MRARGYGESVYDLDPSVLGPSEVRLDVGTIGLQRAGSLSGRVTDPSGAGVAAVELRLQGFNEDRSSLAKITAAAPHVYFFPRRSQTLPDGHYAFQDLPPGTYTLKALIRNTQMSTSAKVAVAAGEAKVLDVQFPDQGELAEVTFLIEGPDGAPLKDAQITIYKPLKPVIGGQTGADGCVTLLVKPNRYEIRATSADDSLQWDCLREFDLSKDLEIVLSLKRKAPVELDAYDPGGVPVPEGELIEMRFDNGYQKVMFAKPAVGVDGRLQCTLPIGRRIRAEYTSNAFSPPATVVAEFTFHGMERIIPVHFHVKAGQ